jgi:predicted RNA-binding Zn ribbon-like protein
MASRRVTCQGGDIRLQSSAYLFLPNEAMEPLFLGSHPAMDFLNTTFSPEGKPVELIGDGQSFLEWLVAAALLPQAAASRLKRRSGAEALNTAAEKARAIRAWASDWIARWSHAPHADYEADLRRLNGMLHGSRYHKEILSGSRWQLAEHYIVEDADDLLGLLATQIASLVTNEDPTLIRRCAGSGCTLWFLDRTKGHRRLFCSASACGNRAKVAAFRARQKQTGR